jgi:hypothetical protein
MLLCSQTHLRKDTAVFRFLSLKECCVLCPGYELKDAEPFESSVITRYWELTQMRPETGWTLLSDRTEYQVHHHDNFRLGVCRHATIGEVVGYRLVTGPRCKRIGEILQE